ncbi:DNA cytosine methyltransferase [Aliiroseovarius crassostreae]|uniref:DNA cytosine methyltransferase n=1 Tax=Aliiroseovarius crassostreae TaxID=154981 RepID=UPI00220564D6|nr:DNA cytosine methyltransferase [Aliiroseovarius crassostreae]UWQ02846.1 DNA cytosine methyltransferase [Aliiroseovarius crassostreae]
MGSSAEVSCSPKVGQEYVKRQRKIRVVDLFSGAGGFTLAAHNTGCATVFAIEKDRRAAETFRNRFVKGRRSGTRLYETSILDAEPAALAKKHFKKNKCDLVLGGPPCQGFSTHRIKDAGVDDPRNNLILRYFEFVAALKPTAFLMENVPGILWPRHARYLEEFSREAKASGYKLFPAVKLNAQDYGVPQRRKRVFFLGVKEGVAIDQLVWPPAPTHGDEGAGLLPWKSCKTAFDPAPIGDPNDIHMNHGPELVAAFRNTPANGGSRKDSGRVLDCHKEHDGHKDVYGRINPDLPAPTMTTACINPSKGRFVHPVEHHGITARQAARIQTFPDDFVFSGGLMAAGMQIGNAVPVKLGEALIGHLADWICSLELGEFLGGERDMKAKKND